MAMYLDNPFTKVVRQASARADAVDLATMGEIISVHASTYARLQSEYAKLVSTAKVNAERHPLNSVVATWAYRMMLKHRLQLCDMYEFSKHYSGGLGLHYARTSDDA